MMTGENLEIELRGKFIPRPVQVLNDNIHDLYSLMIIRSSMMGWSSSFTSAEHRPRLWFPASCGIHGRNGTCEHPNTAWVHVVPENTPAASVPLVIQPLLHCMLDCVRALGDFTVSELRICSPLDDATVEGHEILGGEWFRWVDGTSSLLTARASLAPQDNIGAPDEADSPFRPISLRDAAHNVFDHRTTAFEVLPSQKDGELSFRIPGRPEESAGWFGSVLWQAVQQSVSRGKLLLCLRISE
ncbi:MAG: hypothetical protein QG608_1668 [Actinomycetota bacterium]|nr:hypothetical protein [Actinomycetota bacterium]